MREFFLPANEVWPKGMFLHMFGILSIVGGGRTLYDFTSCLAAWSHVSSRGSLSLVPCSFWGSLSRGVSYWNPLLFKLYFQVYGNKEYNSGVQLSVASYNYCPQMKFVKVMFSQVSVCPRGGVCPIACWDTLPPGQTPPWQTPPWADPPCRQSPCAVDAGIRLTSGRYTSHWNTFLFCFFKKKGLGMAVILIDFAQSQIILTGRCNCVTKSINITVFLLYFLKIYVKIHVVWIS